VLFAKEPSVNEVYNDLDGRLVNLFRCAKYHTPELLRELEMLLPSREMFESYAAQPGLTDIQRAARFCFVLKLSYGGQCRAFGPRVTAPTRFLLEKLYLDIERARKRLERTVIEHLDFERCIAKYDSPETCFFVSPPYVESVGYDVPFADADHERLSGTLRECSGGWLLLYNDHRWVRETYRRMPAYRVSSTHSLRCGRPRRAPQLLISNRPIPSSRLRSASRKVARVRLDPKGVRPFRQRKSRRD
jgi:DNA adenine methylase